MITLSGAIVYIRKHSGIAFNIEWDDELLRLYPTFKAYAKWDGKTIVLRSNVSLKEQITSMAHEVRHLYQQKHMGFFMTEDNTVYWMNKPCGKLQNTLAGSKEEYSSAPYEIDARAYADYIIVQLGL